MRRAITAARTVPLPAVAVAAALALAGCVEAAPEPTPTAAIPTPSGSATPTPTPTNPATEPQGDLEIACAELVDADAMYAFDPNFALIGPFQPGPDSAGERALDAGGVVCRWVRESGGISIDLVVASFGEQELTALKDEAFASSEMVPTYGEEAYFDPATGTATVFQGSYWLVITSPAFVEPGEPTPIIEAALDALSRL
jgi:hypothetical protein